MKKIGEVSPPFGWRAWLALIDEDSECCRAQRRLLTTRCHEYIISDKSNAGQDASLLIEMGNPGSKVFSFVADIDNFVNHVVTYNLNIRNV